MYVTEYAKKKKLDIDYKSLIRAAIHDYYLYDWHDKGKWHKPPWLCKILIALQNAIRLSSDINELKKMYFLRHVSFNANTTKIQKGWILQKCEKSDFKRLQKRKKN